MPPLLRALPAALSFLVLAAHFLRGGQLLLTVACALVPLILLVPRLWAVRAVQVALILAAFEWVRTTIIFIRMRQAMGEPWTRLAIILGVVAAFALVAALLLQSEAFLRSYRKSE